jgi:hypothetical protein
LNEIIKIFQIFKNIVSSLKYLKPHNKYDLIPPADSGVHEWNFLACRIEEIANEEEP